MSIEVLLRWLGIFMILDGVLSLAFGKSYLRPWRHLGGPIAAFVSFFLRWPSWLIRVVGAGEAVAGLRVLEAAPISVRENYRVVARVYDPFLTLWNSLLPNVEHAVDQSVTRYLPAGGSVLDLGCGTGANVARLQRLGIPFSRYIGVDLTPEMLEVARQKFGHLPNVSFSQLDLLRDTLPMGEFDLVISTWVFSHLKERAGEVVEKARERLKPDGHMVLLMLSETGSWFDFIVDATSRPLEAKPLPRDVYLSFPGRLELRQFAGGFATLLVLRK